MIACVDVDYQPALVTTAVVAFDTWVDEVARIELVVRSREVPAAYRPGAFYERELPYLLEALDRMPPLDAVIIDGYVWLAPEQPGLGWHVHEAVGSRVIVVGVAKTRFATATAVEVIRGDSTRPLFVTAVGMDAAVAAEHVRTMHGEHRIPTLLRLADALARGHAR